MTAIRTTCPACRATLSLEPTEVLLMTRSDGPATYMIACGACDTVNAKRADALAEWLLLASGVSPSAPERDAVAPEPLPLPLDELAELYSMLVGDEPWSETLVR